MDSLREGRSVDRVSAEVAAIGVRHQLVTRWSSLVAVDVTPTAPVDVETKTRNVPSLLPASWDFSKLFGGNRRSATGAATAIPMADRTEAPGAGVAIGQRIQSARIGSLPRGGTPATLLIALGTSGIGVGGALLALAERRRRDGASR